MIAEALVFIPDSAHLLKSSVASDSPGRTTKHTGLPQQSTAAGSGGYLGSMNNKEDDADRDY